MRMLSLSAISYNCGYYKAMAGWIRLILEFAALRIELKTVSPTIQYHSLFIVILPDPHLPPSFENGGSAVNIFQKNFQTDFSFSACGMLFQGKLWFRVVAK